MPVSSSTAEAARTRLAVLISGAGSNMLAIAHACASGQVPAGIVRVIADTPGAAGIGKATALGLATQVVDRRRFVRDGTPDRSAFEQALTAEIAASGADLVVLAGFMRILSAEFVDRHAGRMLNIHPSLLPKYKGTDTHARVLAAGDAEHGASVHYVTAELDGGPLVAQAAVPVLAGDDVARLSARVHAREHILYPMVIEWIARGRLLWNGGSPSLDGQRLVAPVRIP